MRLSPPLLSLTFATALICPLARGADPPTGERTPAPGKDSSPEAESPPIEDSAPRTEETELPSPNDPEGDETQAARDDENRTTPPPQSSSAPGGDDSEREARAAFLEGDRLYLEGDYEGAVEAFQLAYSLSGRIEMLFNLANAHERLGQYERASVALRGYIPHSAPEHRPALERRLARFEDRASERRQKEEKTAEVVKELKENPQPFPVERTVGIGLLTLGGASIVTGAAFGISALNARSTLKESCEDGSSGRLCSPDADKYLERDRAHSTVADVAVLAGVVGVTVGTVFLIRSKRKEKQKLDIDVGVGPSRLSLEGRF